MSLKEPNLQQRVEVVPCWLFREKSSYWLLVCGLNCRIYSLNRWKMCVALLHPHRANTGRAKFVEKHNG
jgi:hypothetical protein